MNSNPTPDTQTSSGSLTLRLFLAFMKIGAFTFGGGWAMISIIEREIVDKNHWIERQEFLDLLALAQSLPGILAVNIAVAVGDKLRGGKGSAVAALGTILPSFLIILLIAIFLTPDVIKHNRVVAAIFMGIRPAVVALIIAPVITSAKAAKLTLKTIWIPVIVALMVSINIGFVSSPILYIVLGGVGGWLYFEWSSRQLQQKKGGEL
ncbi:MAG: chromate transporter [Muribaculaceae bacterium]|nr:chromate transporter [Muribaculaceae bacterium]